MFKSRQTVKLNTRRGIEEVKNDTNIENYKYDKNDDDEYEEVGSSSNSVEYYLDHSLREETSSSQR